MHTFSDHDLHRQPQQLLDDARRGEPAIVTVDGEPVMMTLPLGKGLGAPAVLLDLAATLYDREQISLGMAARIAGLGYVEMLDELARRGIPTLRQAPGDLARDLTAFGG